METKDESFGVDQEGTFEEVDPPHAATLRLDGGRRVRTTFTSEGTGICATTVFDPQGDNPVEMQRAGWQAVPESYAALVERRRRAVVTVSVHFGIDPPGLATGSSSGGAVFAFAEVARPLATMAVGDAGNATPRRHEQSRRLGPGTRR
mgnify:CR=1 FL=1